MKKMIGGEKAKKRKIIFILRLVIYHPLNLGVTSLVLCWSCFDKQGIGDKGDRRKEGNRWVADTQGDSLVSRRTNRWTRPVGKHSLGSFLIGRRSRIRGWLHTIRYVRTYYIHTTIWDHLPKSLTAPCQLPISSRAYKRASTGSPRYLPFAFGSCM